MSYRHLIIVLVAIHGFVYCDRPSREDIGSSATVVSALRNMSQDHVSKSDKVANGKVAFDILQKSQNDLTKRENLTQLATKFYELEDLNNFRQVSYHLLNASSAVHDSTYLGKAYKNLGKYYIETSHNDSSFYFYIKAEKIALDINQFDDLGEIYIDKAFCQLYESDFAGCEISASKALKYLDKERFKFKIYDAYNLIGIASNEMQNFDKAIEYHTRALFYLKKNGLNNKYHLDASSYNNIGYVYQNLEQHEKAITNFEAALQSESLYADHPTLYAMLIDNLAYSKFKMRDYTQLPDLFFKSLRIRDSLKTDISGIILNKIHLSELYSVQRDTLQAFRFANEALALAKNSGVPSDILATLRQMSMVDQTKSILYSREYIRINDSLQRSERNAREKFARIAFETDEITVQNIELHEQNRALLYFFVGTIMIGALLFVIRTQRSKNRELLLKQSQQTANEEIYNLMITQQKKIEEGRIREKKRIAQELHDGILGRLFGTRLNLESLNRSNEAELMQKRSDYLVELKNIEQDIREISHDLNREKYVIINNFSAILNNLLENQRGLTNAVLKTEIGENIIWDKIPNTIKINIYRIIQEGLQNINKYAQAQTITLQISMAESVLNFSLKDDGIGFDTNGRRKGIGLQNIISRAHELSGVIDIKSRRGKGTLISIRLPIATLNETIV